MLVRITYKGSPIVGAIPVSPEIAAWAIGRLVAECPARRYDYDTVPSGYLDDTLPTVAIGPDTDFVRVSPDCYVAV